ncbi:MAG: hypothetical protein Q4C91_03950 [Eubacteriales bacterium]|nr:hypothetical protein [Eubacteriales bacterium]
MKILRNYVKSDLRQLVKSYTWLIGMIGVAVFLFFALETQGFYNNNVVSTYTFATMMTGALITYVFCAFPYATTFSEELEHQYARYCIIRGNLKWYVLSKSLVIYFSSIVVMLGGSFLFLILCRTQVPWMDWEVGNDYGSLLAECYGDILRANKPIVYCMLYALHTGLLAGMLSLVAAFCSIHISNRVLILVMPAFVFRILASLNIAGYNIYIFYCFKIFEKNWQNFLFIFLLSAIPSLLLTIGIYQSMKRKL